MYAGEIHGQTACFTVTEDKTVVFQHGDKIYGPYTEIEDPTAIPKDEELANYMTGVELRQGDDILFRVGVLENSDFNWLYTENGEIESVRISYVTNDGIERYEHANAIDPLEPSASTILLLIHCR